MRGHHEPDEAVGTAYGLQGGFYTCIPVKTSGLFRGPHLWVSEIFFSLFFFSLWVPAFQPCCSLFPDGFLTVSPSIALSWCYMAFFLKAVSHGQCVWSYCHLQVMATVASRTPSSWGALPGDRQVLTLPDLESISCVWPLGGLRE